MVLMKWSMAEIKKRNVQTRNGFGWVAPTSTLKNWLRLMDHQKRAYLSPMLHQPKRVGSVTAETAKE